MTASTTIGLSDVPVVSGGPRPRSNSHSAAAASGPPRRRNAINASWTLRAPFWALASARAACKVGFGPKLAFRTGPIIVSSGSLPSLSP